MAKNIDWGNEDKPVQVDWGNEDEPVAKKPLLDGIVPSKAGAGRGVQGGRGLAQGAGPVDAGGDVAQADPMGTGAGEIMEQPRRGQSVLEDYPLPDPQLDPELNRQAMLKSRSPDSVMFTSGRGLEDANQVIERGNRRQGPGRGTAKPTSASTASRAQQIADMDAASNPDNPDYLPVTDNAVDALGTDARGGMDAKRTKGKGRVLDADIPPWTLASGLRDAAAGAMQIVPTAVKGVADIAQLTSGGYVGNDLSGVMESGMGWVRDKVGSERAAMQAKRFQQDMNDPALNAADVVVGNPGAMADQLLPQVGSMFLPAGVGVAAGRLATRGKAGLDAAALAQRANKASDAAVVGTTAAQNAADSYTTVREQGGSQSDAYKAAGIAALATAAVGKLTGGGAEGDIARLAAGGKASVKAIPKAAFKEGVQETGEEGGQYVAESVGLNTPMDANAAAKRMAVAGTLGSVMGGGVQSIGVMRQKIKDLRAAGDTATADLLQVQHDQAVTASSVDGELNAMPGSRLYADHYRTMRTSGIPPGEAAARAAMAATFGNVAGQSGVSERATAAALEAASGQPLERVPGFLQRFFSGLARRGVVTPVEGVDVALETARDNAIRESMDAVLELERKQKEEFGQDDAANAETSTEPAPPPSTLDQIAGMFAPSADTAADTANGSGTVQPDTQQQTATADANESGDPVLQNRNRATPGSISQMQSIAAKPDYRRMSFSRDFANGAPVVSGGDIPAAQLGRKDTAVTSKGRRIPVQYAVLEASDVVASNSADGLANAEYGDASRTRAIAGNGRIAGLQAAYGMGTTGEYVQELAEDDLHGVAPDVIRGMKSPVLVRVMQSADITRDIGDESNTTGGLELTAVERAKNDLNRVDLDALEFHEDGGISTETQRQFVQSMPVSEQNGLIDTNTGQPNRQAADRLNNAIFAKAYGSDQLIRLYAEAQDPEARVILMALARVAPKMVRLEGLGEFDIRDTVTQAAEIAVNARRNGVSLKVAARQFDMNTNPMAMKVVEFYASNSRSAKRIAAGLADVADQAYSAGTAGNDMFGGAPNQSQEDIINSLPQDETSTVPPIQGMAHPAGSQLDGKRAGGAQADGTGQSDAPSAARGAGATPEGGTGKQDGKPEGKPAAQKADKPKPDPKPAKQPKAEPAAVAPTEPIQTPAPAGVSVSGIQTEPRPDGTLAVKGDQQAIQETLADIPKASIVPINGGVVVGRSQADNAKSLIETAQAEEEFDLNAPTKQELLDRQKAIDKANREKEKEQRELAEKERKQKEHEQIKQASYTAANSFELGGNVIDNLNSQQDIFSAPAAPQTETKPAAQQTSQPAPKPTTEPAKPAKPAETAKPAPVAEKPKADNREPEIIEMRKRLSVLNSLLECLKS